MLRGKALNVLSDYSQGAHDLLSKAVKLDPRLAEAWIQLGESYWKNRDVEGAKNCFVGALNHVRTEQNGIPTAGSPPPLTTPELLRY